MVLLASSFDQSKYLRAEDLTQEKLLRIKSVTVEMVGRGPKQEQKPVVWFTNHVKGLPLNKTNNRTIRGAYGDGMEDGPEISSWCFRQLTSVGRWLAHCGFISRRRSKQKRRLLRYPEPEADPDLDDEIPW